MQDMAEEIKRHNRITEDLREDLSVDLKRVLTEDLTLTEVITGPQRT